MITVTVPGEPAMRHVYLPTVHSEDDLVLAGQVAERLESRSLFVTWSPDGYCQPDVVTMIRAADEVEAPARPEPPPHGLLTEILGRMVAFVAALSAPRDARRV